MFVQRLIVKGWVNFSRLVLAGAGVVLVIPEKREAAVNLAFLKCSLSLDGLCLPMCQIRGTPSFWCQFTVIFALFFGVGVAQVHLSDLIR